MYDWELDITKIATHFVRIQNRKQYEAELPPLVHPNTLAYKRYWSSAAKKCIEGVWGKEDKGYRYMPGNLYYTINYGVVENTDTVTKKTKWFKPTLVDYLWEYSFASSVCKGFSGFELDDEYTCHYQVRDNELTNLHQSCYKKDGTIKEYVDPYEYLKKLHNKPLGRALYYNQSKNNVVLGTRGSFKSYWVAIGEIEYRFIFKGAQSYEEFINEDLTCRISAGSSIGDKSSDMLKKFQDSQKAKFDSTKSDFVKWFGIWGKTGDKGFKPCPFYIRNKGSLEPSKAKNEFRGARDEKKGGIWEEIQYGSYVYHVVYSANKGELGKAAASGGRYSFMNYEEIGLMPDWGEILEHNDGATKRLDTIIGVQWGQGTSGFIEYITAAKNVFLNPIPKNFLGFTHNDSKLGKNHTIGFWVPYYLTVMSAKDEDGNTIYEDAIKKVNADRSIKYKNSTAEDFRVYIMNFPCYVEEMFTNVKGSYLPRDKAEERAKELRINNRYLHEGEVVKLRRDVNNSISIDKYLKPDEALRTFPVESTKKKSGGNIVIYEKPVKNPPKDYYIAGLDPYVEQNIDSGGSFGALYIITNPKYVSEGYSGNTIVATYIAKPIEGLNFFYDTVIDLLEYYGVGERMLYFEKNRGESCKERFLIRNKEPYLAFTPNYTEGLNIYQKNLVSYGFNRSNDIVKRRHLALLNDFLLEEVFDVVTKKDILTIKLIRCMFTINQIESYDYISNFDGVDGLIAAVVGLREIQASEIIYHEKALRHEANIMNLYRKNSKIFNEKYTLK